MSWRFAIGNVIRRWNGEIVIITGHTWVDQRYKPTDPKIQVPYSNWIPVGGVNVSGGTSEKTYKTVEQCGCTLGFPQDTHEETGVCLVCEGSGSYEKEHPGLDKAQFIANNVKDWIKETVIAPFEF